MSLIAYKDGIIAADTGEFMDDIIVGHSPKIKKIDFAYPGTALLAAVGWSSASQVFFNAKFSINSFDQLQIKAEREFETPDDFQGIAIVKLNNGPDITLYTVDQTFGCTPIHADCIALGSAYAFLYGAMAAGCSAQRAVELAMNHTTAGAGVVKTIQF